VVDLPTPPLQDETAMMCLTPRRPPGRASGASSGFGGWAVMRRRSVFTQGSDSTLALAALSNWSLTGQAGVVSSMANETSPAPASTLRSLMKPHDTMSMPKSGSMIFRSWARTSPSLELGAASVTGPEAPPPDSARDGVEAPRAARGVEPANAARTGAADPLRAVPRAAAAAGTPDARGRESCGGEGRREGFGGICGVSPGTHRVT